jgi:hypothetical protein
MLQLVITVMCFDPDLLASSLLGQFAEAPVATADARAGATTLYTSKGGSWTLVQIIDGKACVVAAGEGWSGRPNI